MSLEFEFEFASTYEMLDKLDSTISPAGLSTFLQGRVVPMLRERASSRFSGNGDSASGKWLPLSAATENIRRWGIERGIWPGINPSTPINKRSGELEEYITNGNGSLNMNAAETVLKYPQESEPAGKLGSKVRTAQAGRGRTPARPVLAVDATDLGLVVRGLADYIMRGG